MNNPLRELNASGQSVWCDNIHRAMLTEGELTSMIEEDDLRGVTSNPSIFDKAISSSSAYDSLLQQQLNQQPQPASRDLFFALAIEDIREACQVMRPVYDKTDGEDGMVSLEVSPDLAYDCEATITEARSLWQRIDQPNLMIKVPATEACLPAIEQLIADGINVNVTLLFSVERYQAVADAYLRGLEQRQAKGQSVAKIASVASFFISRVDSAIDPLLQDKRPEWQGQIAIANAKLAYQHYLELFNSERFNTLKAQGALPQRLLWASTGTKNPNYSKLLYIEQLIGPNTVNTMPPATYEAFRENGQVAPTLEQGVDEAQQQIQELAELGIDLAAVTEKLEQDGVKIFADAFKNLLDHLETKAAKIAA